MHKAGFLVPVVKNLSGAPRPKLSGTASNYLAGLGVAPDAEAARHIAR